MKCKKLSRIHDKKKGNGQKRELPVLFGQKRMYPENNSGRECCWSYLIGQHPLSPVFGQKRPGTPGNSYFAQLPPVFGHFMFLSGGLLDCSSRSTEGLGVCVCVFSSHPSWTSSSLDVPAGVTQEEGHTGFLIHLPSAVRALIFVARRIQPFLSLVDREVEFCVLTN